MHKKDGNILIISSMFLMVAIIFFLSIYKILGLNIDEKNQILNRGALDLDKRKEYVVNKLQTYANTLEKIELEKKYLYPKELVDSTLAIENLQMQFKTEEVILSYINMGNKQKNEFELDYIKEKICICEEEKCEYNKEKIIFIPRRRIRNVQIQKVQRVY